MSIAVVACSDETTAPDSVAQPDLAPQLSAGGSRRAGIDVRVKVVDIWGQPITDLATVQFKAWGNTTTFKYVTDNSADDKDPAVGFFNVTLPIANGYEACLDSDTKYYAIDVNASICNNAANTRSWRRDLGTLVMRKRPRVSFETQDMNGNKIFGARVYVSADQITDGFTADVTDGLPGDDPQAADGKVNIILHRAGKYTWCEIQAPFGFELTSPKCGEWQAYWEWDTAFLLTHAPLSGPTR